MRQYHYESDEEDRPKKAKKKKKNTTKSPHRDSSDSEQKKAIVNNVDESGDKVVRNCTEWQYILSYVCVAMFHDFKINIQ